MILIYYWGGWANFLGEFCFIQSFFCVIMAWDLCETTCLLQLCCSHKTLHASSLHLSPLNGSCHVHFCAACSIWEFRAKICLGQNFYQGGWVVSSKLLCSGATSSCSNHIVQGHQQKAMYSIVCMDEILVLKAKFVPCSSSAPSSREKARTHLRCYPIHSVRV